MKFINLIFKSLLYVIILTPFAVFLFIPFSPTKEVFFPFISSQTLFFESVFIIIGILWLFVCFKNDRSNLSKDKILQVIFFFICTLYITSFFSYDISRSFFSTIERQSGLVLYANFFGYFICLAYAFRANLIKIDTYLSFNFILAVIVGVLGIIQVNFLKEFRSIHPVLEVLFQQSFRPEGVFGNTTFTAGYLLINLFLGLHLCSRNKGFKAALIGFGLVPMTMMIFYCQTRGAIMGLYVGLVFLFVYYTTKRNWRQSLTSFILFAGLFLWANHYSFLDRFTDKSSIEIRTGLWGIAWEGFKDHPVLGYGPETFSIPFEIYGKEYFEKYHEHEDKAHNVIMGYLVETGLLGTFAYLLLICTVLYVSRETPMITAALIAYLTQGMFAFDTIATLLPLFIILAVLNETHKNLTLYSKGKGSDNYNYFVNFFDSETGKESCRHTVWQRFPDQSDVFTIGDYKKD